MNMSEIIIGLLSGIVSSGIIYIVTEHRKKRQEIYNYWHNFLCNSLTYCEMYVPNETIEHLKYIKDKDGKFHQAIQNILDITNPYGHEDREMSAEEIKLFDNFRIALNEFEKWKNKSK